MPRFPLLTLLLQAGTVIIGAQSAAANGCPAVKLDQGTFQGATFMNGTVNRYLGIPYGQSTGLQNRFRAPIPVPAYTGVHNASAYGPPCPQQKQSSLPGVPPLPTSAIPPSEDCLTMNVITPAGTKAGDKLPVVVYFYGGGFQGGSADVNDGSFLVSQSVVMKQPIVFVSMNTRQSAWGFLASKEVEATGEGNFSLLDQRLALKWVQKYIKQFGGDPTKVTLNGESAGAFSIALQLVAKNGNSEGLFRGAAMQSGFPLSLGSMSSRQGIYDLIVQGAGCAGQKDTLACLRSVSFATLQKAVDATPNAFDYQSLNLSYVPVVDGNFITASAVTLVQEGKMAKVPFLASDCDDEGTLFTLALLNITTDAETQAYWKSNYFPTLNATALSRLAELYPEDVTAGSPFGTGTANVASPQYKRLAAFHTDWGFQALRRILMNERPAGVKAWSSLSKRYKSTPNLGSFHTSDVALTLSGASELQVYLVNFINSLDPNVGKPGSKPTFNLIQWPEYTSSSKQLLTALDANASAGIPPLMLTTDDFRQDALEFLMGLENQFPTFE